MDQSSQDFKITADMVRRTPTVFRDPDAQRFANDIEDLAIAFEHGNGQEISKVIDRLEVGAKVVYGSDWRSAAGEALMRAVSQGGGVQRLTEMRLVQGVIDMSRGKVETLGIGSR